MYNICSPLFTMKRVFILALCITCCQPSQAQKRSAPSTYKSWEAFGGGAENIHYSSLKQIDRSNVSKLRMAWQFDTGDAGPGSEMQCNPIMVEGVLYITSPKLRVAAVDATTGRRIWSFEPIPGRVPRSRRSRGVMHWTDGKQSRIFVTAEGTLFSLYAKTGQLDDGFGNKGEVDLREGLGRPVERVNLNVTTPGVVFEDMLILGSQVGEAHPSAPGDIRAYDVRTGKQRWTFHTIPRPGEFGYDTWPPNTWKHTGGANNWAGMALDRKRGLVFVPTGSAAFDFYGADRHGDNLFSNTLLCLNARTGERKWHFQAIKHDVWDRDFPSAPSLVTVRRNGKLIDAVAQITKSGHVFVFHRETGESLFPLQTRQVPPSTIDGELLARTQVVPLKPEPFSRQQITEDILTTRTPEANRIVLERLRKLRNDGPFTPPSLEGSIVFPGYDGGGEWGGPAFDPETGLFYVNANEMAWILRLVPKAASQANSNGQRLYVRNCAACHGDDGKGSPPQFPSLENMQAKFTEAQVEEILRKGAGRMPGFAHLGDSAVSALLRYVVRKENIAAKTVAPASKDPTDLKYTIDGYNKFLDPDGYPAVAPPWGTLNAINLDTGDYAWKIPFGEFPALAAKGIKNTGTENYGGGIVTAGGLFFIGATNHDRKFRAYDKLTGKLLWETTLPASGNATPAMYEWKGKQYIVIGAGGGKSGAPSGGTYVAFALP
ncbi:MAG: PQQ-binding-like beta-propeller repeat protein [Acidobacteria bacterium]|nr:PQQ-binding-like beta-propeller repeat protein [Acidobacteriota bacterium]